MSEGTRGRLVGCADVQEALDLYLDGEADQLSCEEIRTHLAGCPGCARELEQESALKDLVRRSCGCQPAPEPLRERILARIERLTVTQPEVRVVVSDGETVFYAEQRTTTVEGWEP